MSNPTGFIANDLMVWACQRVFVEPVVNTVSGTAVVSAGASTITPASMTAIYVGALLLYDIGTNQEVIVVTSVTSTTFTALFSNTHLLGVAISGATFPTGQPNDILFTQVEVLAVLTDALNDFMLKTWPLYNIVQSSFVTGVRAYDAPSDAIRIERINRQDSASFTVASQTDVTQPGVTTITPASMIGIRLGMTLQYDTVNTELVKVLALTATTFTANFAYTHLADCAITVPASITGLRDVSVSDLDMKDPQWAGFTGTPTMYFEDELNVGQYGSYPLPENNFVSEVWYSQRGPVLLSLNSLLMIPDPLAYIPYYGMLARMFGKDGELRDPQRGQYCQQRYDKGVEIVVRLLEGLQAWVDPGPPGANASA